MNTRSLATLVITLLGIVPIHGQEIVREIHTSKVRFTDIKLLGTPGRILAVASTRIPLISKDGGATFESVLSSSEQLLFGSKAVTATDGYGRGIISGGTTSWLLYLTSDAGETWRHLEFPATAREAWVTLSRDGNARLGSLVSSDAGESWRACVLPDSIPNLPANEWFEGYSFGRGALIRPFNVPMWYQVDHATGLLTERPDILADATYVGELANGAMLLGSNLNGDYKVSVCLPGNECYDIDSVDEFNSLFSYQIRELKHFDDYIALTFTSAPYFVTLGPSGYRVFIPHSGAEATIVRSLVSSSLNDIHLDSTHLGIVADHGLVATNFADGSVLRLGLVPETDRGLGEPLAFRDAVPLDDGVYVVSTDGNVHRIDSTHDASLEWRFRPFSLLKPQMISSFESADAALNRYEAQLGCLRFWGVAKALTVSVGPRGIRLERHDVDSTSTHRNDTISIVSVSGDGSQMIVGHRSLWSSTDSAKSWDSVPIPDVGSVISSYVTHGTTQLVGFRGFSNVVNDVDVSPTPGGLYIKRDGGEWEKVKGIPGEYVYNVSRDGDGALWVVSTTAKMAYIVDNSGSKSETLAIDVLQGSIDIHLSQDGGRTWNLAYSDYSSGLFNAITGVLSQSAHGHVIALSNFLLFRANGSVTFDTINVLPFGARLYSARFDANGRVWVAASDGIYQVDLSSITSVGVNAGQPTHTFSVQPNPIAIGQVGRVYCSECTSEQFELFDVFGNRVQNINGAFVRTDGTPSGMYFLRSTSGLVAKLIIM